MEIIRIEHSDGFGIFRTNSARQPIGDEGNTILQNLEERHADWINGMPLPKDDGIDLFFGNKKWFCGFKNRIEFDAWVKKEEVQELKKYNYRVYLIVASEFQLGKCQVVFTKESIISKLDITETFN